MNKKYKKLEDTIKYRFRDKELLITALTHPSFSSEAGKPRYLSNQRMEFLGDAVLELVVSDYLYGEHPDIEEGELTRRRSSLVFEAALCKCAREISLGDYLLLGVGEMHQGGNEKPSILADAFEALTGAIYLDGGIKKARKFIMKNVIGRIDEMSLIKDYKSLIQSHVQKTHRGTLKYMTRDAAKGARFAFESTVYINGEKIARGLGHSKKDAEQDAALRALRKLKVR